jgi:hypothetical protein
MGSAAFVIALVLLSGLIVLLAASRWSSGLRNSLARMSGYASTNAEAMPSRAKNNIASGQSRHTSAFQLRVQVAQNPLKSMPPR